MILSQVASLVGAGLHLFFAAGEIIPLSGGLPRVLSSVLKKKGVELADEKPRNLVVAIVQNAGTYNFIVALGFLLAAFPIGLNGTPIPEMAAPLRAFFFGAAILAGLMGLSISKLTLSQVLVGALGFAAMASEGTFR